MGEKADGHRLPKGTRDQARTGDASVVAEAKFHLPLSSLRGNGPSFGVLRYANGAPDAHPAGDNVLAIQPPVWNSATTPLAMVRMLMHITPKANWMPHASEDPLVRPLMIARQVRIAKKTQAAPNA